MAALTKALTVLVAYASPALALLPVVGVNTGTYPRYEIRDLHNNHPEQWSLYIQALHAFQSDDYSQAGSYYQISGIHGLPNVAWDDVNGDGGGTGYCTHSMNIFPTWHRPYVTLYEQQLVAHAQSIAQSYPESNRQTYVDAANQLRAPYFDWAVAPAAGRNVFPNELSDVTVNIETSTGPQTVYNPLYTFRFTQLPDFFPGPYNTWTDILKYPTSGNPDAASQMNLATQAVNQAQGNQRSGVFQMFTNCPNYMQISNDQSNGNNGCPVSLESLHNNFHVTVGGSGNPAGHMTVVPVSGFDPVFMLHHCMVDRLFAMWQVLHPDSYIQAQASSSNTYTIHQGDVQDGDSPLTPFRDGSGNFWTSNRVRDTTVFHYTYPELQTANGDARSMQAQVAALYGDSATQTAARMAKRTFGKKFIERQVIKPSALFASNGSSWQYKANIETAKYALGGSYSIFIFLTDPASSDPGTWAYDPAAIGSYGVFASEFMKSSDVVSSSTVSLTEALANKVDSGDLESLEPMAVVPYLTKNLQWRIAGPDGKEVAASDVPSLKVGVVSSTLSVGSGILQLTDTLTAPLWSTFNLLSEITAGKVGGA